MYYKIYIHPTCARRAPRQPPTDIYLLIVGSIYPIQNVKMYIPPPQYHSIHVAHCSWEQQSLYLCICVFVFLYLSGCQLSLGTFSFFVCVAGNMAQNEIQIHIYIQLTYIPRLLRIYHKYLTKFTFTHHDNQTTFNWHISTNCWQHISNTKCQNIHIWQIVHGNSILTPRIRDSYSYSYSYCVTEKPG